MARATTTAAIPPATLGQIASRRCGAVTIVQASSNA
jgi:hypothetical protein